MKKRKLLGIKLAGFLSLMGVAFLWFGVSVSAANLTVDSVADNTTSDGACTLREALINVAADANTHIDCAGVGIYGTDTIGFNIVGAGPHVITPATALPTIAANTTIDGSTQTGASCGTLVTGTQHTILVEIDMSSVANQNALRLNGADITIRGLAIHSTTDDGTFGFGTAIRDLAAGADNRTIECNYIGTDAAGTTVGGNASGAVLLLNTSNTTMSNNLVAGSGLFGIGIYGVFGSGSNNVFSGNMLGVDPSGAVDANYANNGGIFIAGDVSDSIIGGLNASDRNIIVGTGDVGVTVGSFSGVDADNVSILGNSIYSTNNSGPLGLAGLGIDIIEDENGDQIPEGGLGVSANDAGDSDSGPNDYLNFPEVSSAVSDGTDTTVNFDLDVPAGNYRIEFFSNDVADPSGYGEGQTFVGAVNVTSAGSGSESFSGTLSDLSSATILTATTTEDLGSNTFGSTSEFSLAVSSSVVLADTEEGSESDSGVLADTGLSTYALIIIATTILGSGLLIRRYQ
jgi:hypothetical protein